MGLLDGLLQGLSGAQGGSGGEGLEQALFQMLGQGGAEGLSGLAQNFQSQGLGDVFSSWVSTGENKPIQPQQLQGALGPDIVRQLAGGSGMSLQAVLPLLAQLLPVVIDKLTPQGQLPKNNDLLQQGLGALFGRK
jgi:uncharacterized protein YidB (DUF937 family)